MQKEFRYEILSEIGKESLLIEWKSGFHEEQFNNFEANLGTYKWYKICDKNNNECYAVFQVIPVRHEKRNKNICFYASPLKFKVIEFGSENFRVLLQLLNCGFHGLLEITDGDNFDSCKIYSNNWIFCAVYADFAKELSQEKYNVSFHGNGKWIEIKKNDSYSSNEEKR